MKFVWMAVAAAAMAVAAAAADLTPVDEAGMQKLIASNRGKVLVVNFWATYCVPCRKEMPALVAMHERLKGKGMAFVTISADEAEEVARAARFLEQTHVPAPHYIRKAKSDDAFINALEPKWSGALPATFLYDRSGKKVRSFIGEVDLKVLEAAIQKLL